MDKNEYVRIVTRIHKLQASRDYADEVEAAKLTAEIERLLEIIEPRKN